MIAITLTEFILIACFGMAVLITIGCLVIIKQHRNKNETKKPIKDFDETEKFYWMDDDISFKRKVH